MEQPRDQEKYPIINDWFMRQRAYNMNRIKDVRSTWRSLLCFCCYIYILGLKFLRELN